MSHNLSSTPAPRSDQALWLPSQPAIQKFSSLFQQLDSHKIGFISAQTAQSQMVLSKLDRQILAQIWDLADHDKDGKLSQQEFVMAMWLCLERASKTNSLPLVVPASYWQKTGSNTVVQQNMVQQNMVPQNTTVHSKI